MKNVNMAHPGLVEGHLAIILSPFSVLYCLHYILVLRLNFFNMNLQWGLLIQSIVIIRFPAK